MVASAGNAAPHLLFFHNDVTSCPTYKDTCLSVARVILPSESVGYFPFAFCFTVSSTKKRVFKGFVALCQSYEVITNARLIVCEEAASLEEVLP